jgi:hypothetical protein
MATTKKAVVLGLACTLALLTHAPATRADPCGAINCSAFQACTFANGNITNGSANNIGIGNNYTTGDCISGTYQNEGVQTTVVFDAEYTARWVDIRVFTSGQGPTETPAAQYHCDPFAPGPTCPPTTSQHLTVAGANSAPRLVIVEARGQKSGGGGNWYSTLLSCIPGCGGCGACCGNPGMCNDNNNCTTDGCNPDVGGCWHTCNTGAACACGATCGGSPCQCR